MLEKTWFRTLVLTYLRNAPWPFLKEYLMHGVVGHSPKTVLFRNRDGIIFELNLNDFIQKRIYCFHYFEHECIRFAKRFIKPGDIVLDVGAHVGQFALMAAERVGPQGQVYAFEPHPVTISMLQHNIELNRFSNVSLVPKAVALKPGIYPYYPSLDPSNIGVGSMIHRLSISRENKQEGNAFSVKAVSLDEYCGQDKIEQCAFLKLDVEGYEMDVLLSARELLQKNKNIVVLCELAKENLAPLGISTVDIKRYMAELGFTCYLPRPYSLFLKKVDRDVEHLEANVFFIRKSN